MKTLVLTLFKELKAAVVLTYIPRTKSLMEMASEISENNKDQCTKPELIGEDTYMVSCMFDNKFTFIGLIVENDPNKVVKMTITGEGEHAADKALDFANLIIDNEY